jgi:limonene-1,2-epoxide hydrolase
MARKWHRDATDGEEMVKDRVREKEISDDKLTITFRGIYKKVADGIDRLVGRGRSRFWY